jgi:hypothetical protein
MELCCRDWAEAISTFEALMQENDEDVELWCAMAQRFARLSVRVICITFMHHIYRCCRYMLGLAHGLNGDRPSSTECMNNGMQVRHSCSRVERRCQV